MIKVSVIVPVYNVAKFLPKCLESLCAQTLKDIEIICVDDGSKDESLEILKLWEKRDKRIRIVPQQNQGVSAARNAGLKVARGLYVGFVDADDWVTENYYDILYQQAVKEKADIACGYAVYWKKKARPSKNKFVNGMAYLYPKALLIGAVEKQGIVCSAAIWNKLFRRDLLRFLTFPKGMWYEDFYFNFLAVALANRIVLTKKASYYYRRHSNSSMFSSKRLHFDIFKSVPKIKEKLEELPLLEKEKKEYQNELMAFQIWNMTVVVQNLDPVLRQEYYTLLKKELQGLSLEGNPYVSPFLKQMWMSVVSSENLFELERREQTLKLGFLPFRKVILWGDETRYYLGKIELLRVKFKPWQVSYKLFGVPVGYKKIYLKQRT